MHVSLSLCVCVLCVCPPACLSGCSGPRQQGHRHKTKREMFNTNMALAQDKRWSLEFMKVS